ncbi:MAG: hypothetical protein ACP5IO_04755 [Elusimicrobiales bacterium]
MIVKIVIFLVLFFIISSIFTAVFIFLTRRGFVAVGELTPDVDEIKEILRGNSAVSEYFSRILSAFIIGISIILSVSVIATFILIKWK